MVLFILGMIVMATLLLPIIKEERRWSNERLAHEHKKRMELLDTLHPATARR